MSNSWHIIYVGDPKRIHHLPDAISSVTKDYTLWIPTRKLIQRTRGKDIEVERSLCPGYAFVKFSINPQEVETQVKTATGGYFLKHPGTFDPCVVSDIEIQDLKSQEMEHQNPKSLAESFNLMEGQLVEIKNGPFIGAKGIIKLIKRSKVVIEVKIFGRGVLAEVDPTSCHIPQ